MLRGREVILPCSSHMTWTETVRKARASETSSIMLRFILVYSTPIGELLSVLTFQRLSSQLFCGLPRCTVAPAGCARACGAPTIVRIRDRRHYWREGNRTKKFRIPLASGNGYGTQETSEFQEPQWSQTFAAATSLKDFSPSSTGGITRP
jgi:hypothetical protein